MRREVNEQFPQCRHIIHGLASEKTKTYSIEQMRYLLEHVGEIKNEFDRAWLALITAVPLRPEEVLGLRWRDVDE